jgi:hypothetical protein
MDTLLLTVTVVSLALAGALGMLLARMVREERRRAEARVALLMDLAGANESRPQRVARFSDLDLHPATAPPTVATVGDLFHEHETERAWPRRLLVAGAMAATIGVAVFAWSAMDRHTAPKAPATASSPAQPPLELLSLGHKQEGDTLVISGIVQNPRGASVVSGGHATVLVFGADGALIASGRTPLDFATLTPGAESPFVIRLTATGAARYRIGFRGAHDETLAHVDRRISDSVARKEAP